MKYFWDVMNISGRKLIAHYQKVARDTGESNVEIPQILYFLDLFRKRDRSSEVEGVASLVLAIDIHSSILPLDFSFHLSNELELEDFFSLVTQVPDLEDRAKNALISDKAVILKVFEDKQLGWSAFRCMKGWVAQEALAEKNNESSTSPIQRLLLESTMVKLKARAPELVKSF